MDWHPLGQVLYRKWSVYSFNWKYDQKFKRTSGSHTDRDSHVRDKNKFDTHSKISEDEVDMQNYIVRSAVYGGPVALILKNKLKNTWLVPNLNLKISNKLI